MREKRGKEKEERLKAPLNKGGWAPNAVRMFSDLSQATKDAVRRSKSPLSPPLLRGEMMRLTGGLS